MYAHHTDPLALSTALTVKTRQLGPGLEPGAAEILERVTPPTAEVPPVIADARARAAASGWMTPSCIQITLTEGRWASTASTISGTAAG